MLVPNDILSAKLLVQLDFASADVVRSKLGLMDEDHDLSRDLVALLLEEGVLFQEQAELIRYYTALFVHLRREAILLRLVERKQFLPRQDVLRLLARLELSSYRHHLSAVLQSLGHLSAEEAERLERKTRRRIAKDDRRVLERYRAEAFEGVSRALIPADPLTSEAFRICSLFRTQDTVQSVNASMELIREEERKEREHAPTRELARPQDKELELTSKLEDEPGESDALESDVEEPEEAWKSRWSTDRIKEGHWAVAAKEVSDEPVAAIGPYQVVQCLGQGGMGAVYLCKDGPGLVAVKIMTNHEGEDDDLRFAREGQVYALLDHPNLIHLLDQGTSIGGDSYLVLPVFAGQSLQERLDESGLLEPSDVFEIMEQALAGLEAAHREGIVHRDMKPDNLFLLEGPDLRVKVIDFGIARFLDDLKPDADRAFRTELSMISGTPAFVAPETINSGSADARTDIYSLGIMFFYLLTGRHPLHAERSGDYLSEHLVGVPLTLSQAKLDVYWTKELESLVASMMAKRPEDRPGSCQEILDQLQGGLRALTLKTLNDPPSRPASRSARLSRIFNQFFKHDR